MAVLCSSCAVGPNYKRPAIATPAQHRFDAAQQPAPASLGEMKWFELFQDESLRALIKEALQANYDILIAAQRVLDYEGRFGATRSRLFPEFWATGAASRTGTVTPITSTVGGFGQAAWELDLFGKLRRATEAARAELLATRENQNAVIQSLVADLATAYFSLREYDAELVYVRESISARTESLKLVKARLDGGVANALEVDQAQSLVASAQASAAQLERLIGQTENMICFLVARQPGPIERGKPLTEQYQPPQIPAGLPSALIDRRPDLREAEQMLIAANARVGVAKAAFFPSINLTAGGGYQSADLRNIIDRAGAAFTMSGFVDIPIFDAGRRRGNYKSAKAQHEQLLVSYQRSINNAFREVSDSLIGYQKAKEYRSNQELFTNTLRHQSQLADSRYRGGVASYLEVLDTERERLTAEQNLALAQRDELISVVQVYRALGGGWQ
jgi:multidrug efflux system outer membrane protein